MKKRELLVIVAHPDDEIIWAYGVLSRTKFNKTIICLCRRNDKDRFPKFEKICKILGAKGHIFDLDDSEKGYYKKIYPIDIIKRIRKITKNKKYDYIFTHGKNGEYGHIRHIEVHNAVLEMLEKGILYGKKVFFFSYKKRRFRNFSKYNSNADKLIKLNRDELFMKKNLVEKIYGYPKRGFEVKSSRKIEAFDVKK